MSVHYSRIHDVDVPITDLDEHEADVFDHLAAPPSYQEAAALDPLEGLDYENPITESGGFFDNLRNGWQYTVSNVQNGWNDASNSLQLGMALVSSDLNASLNHSSEQTSDWRDTIRIAARSLVKGSQQQQNRSNNVELTTFSSDSNSDLEFPSELSSKKRRKVFLGHTCVIACLTIMIYFNWSFIVGLFLKFQGGGGSHGNFPILSNTTHDFLPTTIMISLDGFHPHYINAKRTPTLHNMLLHDYGAPYMIPLFPLLTFPNHWTLVTGLYPSEHGIVGNTFYDPRLDKQFVNTDPSRGGLDPDFWRGGEPLWETAFKQGVSLAVHMWPGSEVPGVGIGNGPAIVDKYNGLEVLLAKVDRILTWLDTDSIKKRPQLMLTYVPTIDSFGHKYGISGNELEQALTYVDDFIDLLFQELKNRNLDDIVNVIIVSDHGMAPTLNDRLLYIDDIVDLNKVEHVDGWPLFGLRPGPDYSVNDLFTELKTNLADIEQKDHYSIYKVEDLPQEWNFGGQLEDHKFNYRLAPVWVIPDVGYSVTTHKQMKENEYQYKPRGVHGYNNTELLMRAIFLARGPHFKGLTGSNKKIKPFANTEVYKLVCESLEITPAPNNGSFTVFLKQNLLPEDWVDHLEYPNVPFKVDHVVEDATYDLLWKKPHRELPTTVYVSTNRHPQESLSKETKLATVLEHIPKPTDLTDDKSSATETSKAGDWIDELLHAAEDLLLDVGDHLSEIGEGLTDLLDSIVGDDVVNGN